MTVDRSKPDYYRVMPCWDEPGMIQTAAILTCMATGRVLAGMGGGGDYLAPEVVSALRMRENGGKARVVVDADLWERAKAALDSQERAAVVNQDQDHDHDLDRLKHLHLRCVAAALDLMGVTMLSQKPVKDFLTEYYKPLGYVVLNYDPFSLACKMLEGSPFGPRSEDDANALWARHRVIVEQIIDEDARDNAVA